MEIVAAILIAAAGFVLGPVIGTALEPWVNEQHRKRTYRRLMAEPLFTPGLHRVDVYTVNHSDPVCQDATIDSIEEGRVVFRHADKNGAYLTPFTGREVEHLIVRVRSD